MEMYKLTLSQKDQLIGKKYDGVTYFYPIQDINGDWFVGKKEVENCTNDSGIEWIHNLVLTSFTPKVYTL